MSLENPKSYIVGHAADCDLGETCSCAFTVVEPGTFAPPSFAVSLPTDTTDVPTDRTFVPPGTRP